MSAVERAAKAIAGHYGPVWDETPHDRRDLHDAIRGGGTSLDVNSPTQVHHLCAVADALEAALPAKPEEEWVEKMARAAYKRTMGKAAPRWEDAEGPMRLTFINGADAAYRALRAAVLDAPHQEAAE